MQNKSCEAAQFTVNKHGADNLLYHIVRDDHQEDSITKLKFTSYDEAYDELERFYGDLCCSDERIEYSIEMM